MEQKQRRLDLEAYVGKSVFVVFWDTDGRLGFYVEEVILKDYHVQYMKQYDSFGLDCVFASREEAESLCEFLKSTTEQILSGFESDKESDIAGKCYFVMFEGQEGWFSTVESEFHRVNLNFSVGRMLFRDKETARQLRNKLNTAIGLNYGDEL